MLLPASSKAKSSETASENWGRTTVNAWQLRVYAPKSPVFMS
jgi:hypothetical protein